MRKLWENASNKAIILKGKKNPTQEKKQKKGPPLFGLRKWETDVFAGGKHSWKMRLCRNVRKMRGNGDCVISPLPLDCHQKHQDSFQFETRNLITNLHNTVVYVVVLG